MGEQRFSRYIVFTLLILLLSAPAWGDSWYVDDSHTSGTTNGQSWATAFRYLQDALDVAFEGDIVNVAQGVYRPDAATSGHTSGDANETFPLGLGITIQGGYVGYDAPNPDLRDWELYPTILSGDLFSDDGPEFTNYADNSYVVVNAPNANQTSLLDGFIISGGNGGYNNGGAGAGVFIGGYARPTIRNCLIKGNKLPEYGSGAGIYCDNAASPLLRNCTFEDNQGGIGAGLYVQPSYISQPTLENCRFIRNVAEHQAGGFYNGALLTIRIQDCVFVGNEARGHGGDVGGGAMLNWGSQEGNEVQIVNCLFSGNESFRLGGAVSNNGNSKVKLINCTFSENVSYFGTGGGVNVGASSNTTVSNCILWSNHAYSGTTEQAQIFWEGSMPTVTYSCISGLNQLADPPANTNLATNPVFVLPAGDDGKIGTIDDNLRLMPASSCLDNGDNSAVPADVLYDLAALPRKAGTVDRGPYEVPTSPIMDCNHNGIDDATDMANCPTGAIWCADCNEDRVLDECEIASGTYRDCNHNGILDQCEFADCNENCIDDAVEIAANPTLDANHNGIPDECEFPVPHIWNQQAGFSGTRINVNDGFGPLERNAVNHTAPLPYIWVAASGRNTIVRINTDTGDVIGEYRATPQQHILYESAQPEAATANPSRTTVDLDGSVWVANRDDDTTILQGTTTMGSLVKIGMVIGGTRVDADGAWNTQGRYLKPPFDYCTCEDRDGDGLIRTSSGLFDVLPWDNWSGRDDDGGVDFAEDECILRYVRTDALAVRTVAIDKSNDVWVGGYAGEYWHEKIDGVAGTPIANTKFQVVCQPDGWAGGYGGLLDCNGILWSARGQNGPNGTGLLWFDTNYPNTSQCLDNAVCGDYGLGFDPLTAHIWHSFEGIPDPLLYGNKIAELNPDGSRAALRSHSNPADPNDVNELRAQGVAVTVTANETSHVWVTHGHGRDRPGRTVGHLLATGGVHVGDVALAEPNDPKPGPTGVAVDHNGKVWVTNYQANNVMEIDPNSGLLNGGVHIGAVERTISLQDQAHPNDHAHPYNYGDMTGIVALTTTSTGTWNVVHDGLLLATPWDRLQWNRGVNCEQPDGTSLVVDVRAADSRASLTMLPYQQITNKQNLQLLSNPVQGRFIEIRVRFHGTCPTEFATPSLCDLTVYPVCTKGDLNHDGVVNGLDIQPFVDAVLDAQASGSLMCPADIDGDLDIDTDDIPAFVGLLLGAQKSLLLDDCNLNGIPDANDIANATSQDCNHNFIPDECDIANSTSLDLNSNGIPDECEPDCNKNGVPDDKDIADCDPNDPNQVWCRDVNGNGIPDGCEPDCNHNGIPDAWDVSQETSEDCNNNGVPDECERDCNNNGIPDDCDIADETSLDCNGNLVPDECDLQFAPPRGSLDCNENGIPDECDIAAGYSQDCNGNGFPDECDIASSVSLDVNENGIPDECEEGQNGMYGGGFHENSFMSGGVNGGATDLREAWNEFHEWAESQGWGPNAEISGAEQFQQMTDKMRELGLPVRDMWHRVRTHAAE